MKKQEFQLVEDIKKGICNLTGKKFNCKNCNYKGTIIEGGGTLHIQLSVAGYVKRDNIEEYNLICKIFEPRLSASEVKDYFMQLHNLGVETIPISNKCDKFCYKHGCLGHASNELKNK